MLHSNGKKKKKKKLVVHDFDIASLHAVERRSIIVKSAEKPIVLLIESESHAVVADL